MLKDGILLYILCSICPTITFLVSLKERYQRSEVNPSDFGTDVFGSYQQSKEKECNLV